MRSKLFLIGAWALLAVSVAIPPAVLPSISAAPAIPPIPQEFYGLVTIDGADAPAGSTILARGAAVLTGIPGNPFITTVAGKYGDPGLSVPRLIVQGTEELYGGTPLEFYINGLRAQVAEPGKGWQWTYPYTEGVIAQLNLRYSLVTDTPTPTSTRTPTRTRTATVPPSATPTATPTVTATPTATAMPTASPTETPAPTATPTDTPVPTSTPTLTPTDTPSPTPAVRRLYLPLLVAQGRQAAP